MEMDPIQMPIVTYEADVMACEECAEISKLFPENVLRDVCELFKVIDQGGIDAESLVRLRDYHTLFLLSCSLAVSIMTYGTAHPGVVRLMENPSPASDPGEYGGLEPDLVEAAHRDLGIPREFMKDIQEFRELLLLQQVVSADMYMKQGDYHSCYLLSAAQMLHRYATGAEIRVFSPHGGLHDVVKD